MKLKYLLTVNIALLSILSLSELNASWFTKASADFAENELRAARISVEKASTMKAAIGVATPLEVAEEAARQRAQAQEQSRQAEQQRQRAQAQEQAKAKEREEKANADAAKNRNVKAEREAQEKFEEAKESINKTFRYLKLSLIEIKENLEKLTRTDQEMRATELSGVSPLTEEECVNFETLASIYHKKTAEAVIHLRDQYALLSSNVDEIVNVSQGVKALQNASKRAQEIRTQAKQAIEKWNDSERLAFDLKRKIVQLSHEAQDRRNAAYQAAEDARLNVEARDAFLQDCLFFDVDLTVTKKQLKEIYFKRLKEVHADKNAGVDGGSDVVKKAYERIVRHHKHNLKTAGW